MSKQIVITRGVNNTKALCFFNNSLVDINIELDNNLKRRGNIYMAVITCVDNNTKSVFVDCSNKYSLFIGICDIHPSYFNQKDNNIPKEVLSASNKNYENNEQLKSIQNGTISITKILKVGQKMLVQTKKEQKQGKHDCGSTYIFLSGNICVIRPNWYRHMKLDSNKLSNIISEYKKYGIHIRKCTTSIRYIKKDIKYLISVWNNIIYLLSLYKEPGLIYCESFINTFLVKHIDSKLTNIFVDDEKNYVSIKKFVKSYIMYGISKKMILMDHNTIYKTFNIHSLLNNIIDEKVPLPSGGSIIIQETEGMTVIDINSYKYKKLDNTNANNSIAFINNLEAINILVQQIKIRQVSGIVAIDFIDMIDKKEQSSIYNTLKKCLLKEKSVSISKMNSHCVITLSIQRIGRSISSIIYKNYNNKRLEFVAEDILNSLYIQMEENINIKANICIKYLDIVNVILQSSLFVKYTNRINIKYIGDCGTNNFKIQYY